jgi:hypothetical protein
MPCLPAVIAVSSIKNSKYMQLNSKRGHTATYGWLRVNLEKLSHGLYEQIS